MSSTPNSKNRLNFSLLPARHEQPKPEDQTPVILFMHGVTRCWQTFLPLMSALSTRYQTLGVDFLGHGSSARSENYLVNDHVDSISTWLVGERQQTIGDRPLVLYGHSLGGMVAAAVAAQHPNEIKAIILEDPPFDSMGSAIVGTGWQNYFREVQKYAALDCNRAELLSKLRTMQWEDPTTNKTIQLSSIRNEVALKFMARCVQQLDPQVLKPVIVGEWMAGVKLDSIIKNIHCPTLVLQADPSAGGTMSDADVKAMRSSIKDFTCQRFDGAGHILHQLRHTEILQSLFMYLESLEQ